MTGLLAFLGVVLLLVVAVLGGYIWGVVDEQKAWKKRMSQGRQ